MACEMTALLFHVKGTVWLRSAQKYNSQDGPQGPTSVTASMLRTRWICLIYITAYQKRIICRPVDCLPLSLHFGKSIVLPSKREANKYKFLQDVSFGTYDYIRQDYSTAQEGGDRLE